jgi:hypothetical protein
MNFVLKVRLKVDKHFQVHGNNESGMIDDLSWKKLKEKNDLIHEKTRN